MKKSILLSFVLILSVSFASPNSLLTDKLPSPFVVIPQPQNVILLNGPGLNTGVLKNLLIKGDIKRICSLSLVELRRETKVRFLLSSIK